MGRYAGRQFSGNIYFYVASHDILFNGEFILVVPNINYTISFYLLSSVFPVIYSEVVCFGVFDKVQRL